jgi:sugar lactone lactonase YvrE
MPRVQQKRGTAANLTSVNPTPLAGELIVVSDENTLVIGDGTDAYTSLSYVTATPRAHTQAWSTITDTPTTLSGYGITDAAPIASPTFTGTVTVPGLTSTGQILADDNVASGSVVYSFDGDTNCGIGRGGADVLTLVTGGSERLRVKSTGSLRFVPLSADPASGEAGDVYYHTALNKLRVYNGSRWLSLYKTAWDISVAEYVQSFDVSAKETNVGAVVFRPDGLKMYILGTTSDSVHEYDLTIAWDISTATFVQSKNISAQEGLPEGLVFRGDGLKMYVLGRSGDDVNEYDLSTAWNVSTATYLQNFSVAGQETTPVGLAFSPDGVNMYVVGTVNDSVQQYTLSTAWNVSTASHTRSFSVAGQDGGPNDLFFSADGLRMYVCGAASDSVHHYALSTAWDISTAALLQHRNVSAQEGTPTGLWFSPDGLRMYVCGIDSDKVHQYSLS